MRRRAFWPPGETRIVDRIYIDPQINFGRPYIQGSAACVRTIYERHEAGEDLVHICRDAGIRLDDAYAALAFEAGSEYRADYRLPKMHRTIIWHLKHHDGSKIIEHSPGSKIVTDPPMERIKGIHQMTLGAMIRHRTIFRAIPPEDAPASHKSYYYPTPRGLQLATFQGEPTA
ncbi:hypothetical protein LCGC14_1847360 [marine sediment metagenome]|uniref:DUF433 domain-containing protein n=1 Tax=marine sediment metagenome TaxID=412755 RepID=A0A0F9GZL7_9ZZZZ